MFNTNCKVARNRRETSCAGRPDAIVLNGMIFPVAFSISVTLTSSSTVSSTSSDVSALVVAFFFRVVTKELRIFVPYLWMSKGPCNSYEKKNVKNKSMV